MLSNCRVVNGHSACGGGGDRGHSGDSLARVAVQRGEVLSGGTWGPAGFPCTVLGYRQGCRVGPDLKLLLHGVCRSDIEGDRRETHEGHHEDRDDDGDRAPVILQPKHRMVPLPVRVKSSRGRKPETSVNG